MSENPDVAENSSNTIGLHEKNAVLISNNTIDTINISIGIPDSCPIKSEMSEEPLLLLNNNLLSQSDPENLTQVDLFSQRHEVLKALDAAEEAAKADDLVNDFADLNWFGAWWDGFPRNMQNELVSVRWRLDESLLNFIHRPLDPVRMAMGDVRAALRYLEEAKDLAKLIGLSWDEIPVVKLRFRLLQLERALSEYYNLRREAALEAAELMPIEMSASASGGGQVGALGHQALKTTFPPAPHLRARRPPDSKAVQPLAFHMRMRQPIKDGSGQWASARWNWKQGQRQRGGKYVALNADELGYLQIDYSVFRKALARGAI